MVTLLVLSISPIVVCIDTALSYLSYAQTHPDPLTDDICNAMVETIYALCLTSSFQPVETCADDHEYMMDHCIFTEEPILRHKPSLLQGLDKRVIDNITEREHARLLLFPAYFKVYEWNKLDLGE